MEDLEDIKDVTNGELSENFETALQSYNDKNIEVTAGKTVTFSPNAQDGAHYFIQGQSNLNQSTSTFNTEENADWLDLNGDGYNETDPDVNNNKRADEDFDGNGIIDEKDLSYNKNIVPTTVIMDLEPDAIINYTSYDEDTNSTECIIKNPDGTTSTATLVGIDKIVSKNVPNNPSEIPQNLLKKLFEFENTDKSYYNHLVDPNFGNEGYRYTMINMKDHKTEEGKFKYTLEMDSQDFIDGREYIFEMGRGTECNLKLKFPKDSTITISHTGTYGVVYDVVDSQGRSFKITLKNLHKKDNVRMFGGKISEQSWKNLEETALNDLRSHNYSNQHIARFLYNMMENVKHEGKPLSQKSYFHIVHNVKGKRIFIAKSRE